MTEKIGPIKNPLTIIAIFAGIAEVSGTVVLPFIEKDNQSIFVWFLVFFPIILVILFFVTLNFNNKVLYAPSDFKDENNYIQVNKYDFKTQKIVEVTIPKDTANNDQFDDLNKKIKFLSSQISRVAESLQTTTTTTTTEPSTRIEEDMYVDSINYTFNVTRFLNVEEFILKMEEFEINFQVYDEPGKGKEIETDFSRCKAIWIGKNIPLKLAQFIIKKAKEFYPHLKYIHIVDFTEIYIGGSTKSAKKIFNLKPLSNSDFEKIQTIKNLSEFQNLISSFKK